jgi:uncharacterized protein
LATDSIALTQNPPPAPRAAVAGALHTIVLIAIIAGWSTWGYYGSMRAMENPRRAAVYLITMVWEWALVGYIAWGTKKHGTSLREIIGGRWDSAKDFLKDLGIAVGFWIIALCVLIFAAFALHATGAGEAVRFMLPQTRVEIALWILLSSTAGICEEIIFRGYFQKQFISWTMNVPLGVILSAALFGAGHIYQGPKQAVIIMVYGLLFGILAELRGNLRPGIMTHAWHDTFTGLAARLALKAVK